MPVAPPLRYETAAGTPLHDEAREVYDAVNGLTVEQRSQALYWSDDPGRTATPAGHWVSILTGILRARRSGLEPAAEAYARLGVAVSDAFVCCWATKYRYLVPRPVTYICDHIDRHWDQRLPLTTPSFPEYTSGHSVVSAAAARVLTDVLGETAFVDRAHVRLGLPPRRFASFRHAAEEAAVSRLYGGIHYRRAIEEGLHQGDQISAVVTAMF
ncbi:MAG: vanadium-dependent haloperoxidase [Actinomycetota bacterium]|nr:vanadium-dependent haloperoxidase [Actinomycetota bacterium]